MQWRSLAVPDGELPPSFKRRTRFFVDEGLGGEVCNFLRHKGWNTLWTGDVGLNGHSDEDVLAFAWRERRVLLTHDHDFLDDSRFPEHRNPGILILAGGSGDRYAIGHSIGIVIWIFGKAPDVWRGSKATISADGYITIRSHDSDSGTNVTTRYRLVGRRIEVLEDD